MKSSFLRRKSHHPQAPIVAGFQEQRQKTTVELVCLRSQILSHTKVCSEGVEGV
jgi:hypothetical protein